MARAGSADASAADQPTTIRSATPASSEISEDAGSTPGQGGRACARSRRTPAPTPRCRATGPDQGYALRRTPLLCCRCYRLKESFARTLSVPLLCCRCSRLKESCARTLSVPLLCCRCRTPSRHLWLSVDAGAAPGRPTDGPAERAHRLR